MAMVVVVPMAAAIVEMAATILMVVEVAISVVVVSMMVMTTMTLGKVIVKCRECVFFKT